MILFSKSVCKVFWTSNRVVYKNKVKLSLAKNATRLFCTEVNCEQKPTVRSMMNNNSLKNNVLAWALLVIPVTAFGLGTWQIKRKIWKEDLIKKLKDRISEPVIDFPEDLNEIKNLEYRPVRVRGKFDHSKEIHVGPRGKIYKGDLYSKVSTTDNMAGYLVITPFKLSDRDLTILVNRGWVISEQKLPETRLEGQIEDEVELVGLVRHTENREGSRMNRNLPKLGLWYLKDIEALSEATGAAPYLIDADESSSVPGGPIGGQTNVKVRNDHLTYVIIWYTLSLITGKSWYNRFWRR